jgi:hypothetical protein
MLAAAAASVVPAPGVRVTSARKIITQKSSSGRANNTHGSFGNDNNAVAAGLQKTRRRRRSVAPALPYHLEAGGGRRMGAGYLGLCRSAASDEQQQEQQQPREGDEDEKDDDAAGSASSASGDDVAPSAAPAPLDYTAAYSEDDGDLELIPPSAALLGSMEQDDEDEFASALEDVLSTVDRDDFASALEDVLSPVGEGEHEGEEAAEDAMSATPSAAEAWASAAEAWTSAEEAAAATEAAATAAGAAAAALSEVEEALREVSAAAEEAEAGETPGGEGREEGEDGGEDGGEGGEGGRRKRFAEWAQRLSRSTRERSKTQVRSATEALRLFYQARKSVPTDLAKAIATGVETTAASRGSIGWLLRHSATQAAWVRVALTPGCQRLVTWNILAVINWMCFDAQQ